MDNNKRVIVALALACSVVVFSGCSSVTSHEVWSTIFDGVPSLPSPEELCTEYADKKIEAMKAEQLAGATKTSTTGMSEHMPYAEKRCDDCHDKSKGSGMVAPLNELCLTCHTGFFKGKMEHGPAATRDCLSCHVPHDSSYAPLLKVDKSQICSLCHKEKRVAESLHQKAMEHKLICVDCHDPHYGDVQYFLK